LRAPSHFWAAFSLALLLQSSLVANLVLFGGIIPPNSALAISEPVLPSWGIPERDGSGGLTGLDLAGHVLGKCPLKHTAVDAQISGYAARVTVEQIFENPYSQAIEAVYTFPLSHSSAVDEMKMQIGSRTISGSIKKRDDAREEYQRARSEGRTASLLEQERTNIFTQSVANIPPHSTIKVQIKYSDILTFKSGAYSFVFPLVVGPRYMPGGPIGKNGSGWSPDTTEVPDASKISPPMKAPSTRAGHDVSIDVTINAGMPIEVIYSKLHKIDISRPNANVAHVVLSKEDSIPNKDFVLDWHVGKASIESGYLTHRNGDGFFNIMLVPPAKPLASQICPKEYNFIIDRSGSQRGQPLEKAKETVLYMLKHMNADDTFQIFSFSNSTEQLFARPQPSVPETITEATKYVEAMQANGGTEMRPAVEIATNCPTPANRVRIITLMTDGFIGNDNEVIELVRRTRGSARWFPFGTGNSVNRNLIEGVASAGGGEAEYALLNAPGDELGRQFLEKVGSPILTDINVKFKGVQVAEVQPAVIGDVWAQKPVYLTGRYLFPGSGTVEISGLSGGKPYSQVMTLNFPANEEKNAVLPSLWARAKIEELSHTTHALKDGTEYNDIRNTIESLGLTYHLLTDFTSFVAVDPSNNLVVPAKEKHTVPLESPQGVNMGAFPGLGQIGQGGFSPSIVQPVRGGQQTHQWELRGHNSTLGGPQNANFLQVEPSVIDERHYTSARTERHQKVSPTLPEGAPIPDSGVARYTFSQSGAAQVLGAIAPKSEMDYGNQKAKIISTLDVVSTPYTSEGQKFNQKIDKSVLESLAAWKILVDDEPKLKLRLIVQKTGSDLLAQLKELHVETLKAGKDEIIVNAPVRRIHDIARLKQVTRIQLAD
jgi:Ca-activated chloride channel family protein